jgi:hypothetical protein
MVAVFKTDVETEDKAHVLLHVLSKMFPGSKINFDLEDCDNILRVETEGIIDPENISQVLARYVYRCQALE